MLRPRKGRYEFLLRRFARLKRFPPDEAVVDCCLSVQLQRENWREMIILELAFGENPQQQAPQRHVQVVGTPIKASLELHYEFIALVLEIFIYHLAISQLFQLILQRCFLIEQLTH